MILVDTNVWIDHFRAPDARMNAILDNGEVLTHPMVLGELACGNLARRDAMLQELNSLPIIRDAEHFEVMDFVEATGLMGRGIGFIDAHLLCAVSAAGDATLWTADRRLRQVSEELGLLHTVDDASTVNP